MVSINIKNKRFNMNKMQKIQFIQKKMRKLYYVGIAIKLKGDLQFIQHPVKYQKINENLTNDDKIKTLMHMYQTIQIIKRILPKINQFASQKNLRVLKILVSKHPSIHIVYAEKNKKIHI